MELEEYLSSHKETRDLYFDRTCDQSCRAIVEQLAAMQRFYYYYYNLSIDWLMDKLLNGQNSKKAE